MIGTRINSTSLYQAYISSITIRIKPILLAVLLTSLTCECSKPPSNSTRSCS